MVFNDGQTTTIDYTKGAAFERGLGAASRRALVATLASIHEASTRIFLSKHLKGKSGLVGLHLGCGSGQDSFVLASLLDNESSLDAFDEDAVMIEEAREKAKVFGSRKLYFEQKKLPQGLQMGTRNYDFIYARFQMTGIVHYAILLQVMDRCLKLGGFLILELIPFIGYTAFPYNHAFARTSALIQKTEAGQATSTEDWLRQLTALGFTDIQVNYSPPGFLDSGAKKVVSLILEYMKSEIIAQHKANMGELDALIVELQAYEDFPDVLISRPGTYQLTAEKQ